MSRFSLARALAFVRPSSGPRMRSVGASLLAVALGLLAGRAPAQVTAPAGYTFGSVSLGSSASTTVTFSFTGSVTVGSVSVVTGGVTGQDFQATSPDSSTALCKAQAYSSGSSCTVDITFSPLAPGLRTGAAILRNGSNQVVGIAYVKGLGTGARLGYTTPTVSTFAGTGTYSLTSPVGLSGTAAGFVQPQQIAFDGADNMYLDDGSYHHVIYKITPAGLVSIVAGQYGTNCSSQASITYPTSNSTTLATNVPICYPQSILVDGAGQLWFTDNSVGGIASVDLATGYITSQVVGNFNGFGAPATSGNIHTAGLASLGAVFTVGSDGLGNIYVGGFYDGTSTTSYGQILKVDASGNISLFAGTATPYASSSAPADGTTATSASITNATSIVFDSAGNCYYYDAGRYMIYKIDTGGKVHPFAGSGTTTSDNASSLPYWGTGTASTTLSTTINFANMSGNMPGNMAVDAAGNVYFPSSPGATSAQGTNLNSRVFVFTPSGYAYVLAGSGGVALTNGAVSTAQLSFPTSVALNGTGDVYISETYGRLPNSSPAQYIGAVVRKWTMSASTLDFGTVAKGATSTGQTVTATNLGNAPLTLSTPTSGTNPSASVGFTLLANTANNACSSGAVAVTSSCTVIPAFQPNVASGSVTGTLTFSGNLSSAAASVSLSGTATTGVASLTMTGLPANVSSGGSSTVTVTALDGSSNTFTGYTGTVHFSVSPADVAASLPSDYTFTGSENGTKTFTVALSAVGAHTVTVADTANSLTASENTTVAPAINHFAFTSSPPASTTAGSSFNVTVTAYTSTDSSTVATGYTGPVTLTSTDSSAVLPSGTLNLTAGVGTFSITLKTAGAQTITVADSSGSPTLTSGNIAVAAASPASLVASTGTPQTSAGNTAFANALQVKVLDSYSNAVSGVTVSFAAPTSGASATLSAASCVTATNGMCSVTATANQYGGTYNVAATAGSLSVNFALTNQVPHSFIVTVGDDQTSGVSGTAANCPDQSTGSTASNASCRLRDALAAAAASATSSTGAMITFAMTTPTTITLSRSVLTLPSYTTVQGATSGTGATLTNLITISGGGHLGIFEETTGTANVTLNNLNLTNGSATYGPALYASYSGLTTINQCNITGNKGTYIGAVYGYGAQLTMTNSNVSNNTTTASTSQGAGVYLQSNVGVVNTLQNNTISGNTSGLQGGGIYVVAFTTAVLTNNTIANNTSGTGGGVYANIYSVITSNNNIISGNTATTANPDWGGAGTVTAGPGGNSMGTSTAAGASNGTALLTALGSYGGPTQTMAEQPSSPTICGGAVSTGTDQRGTSRSTTYGNLTCTDYGALQASFSLAFTTQPASSYYSGTNFGATAPVASVEDDGAVVPVTGNVVFTDSASALSGTTTVALNSGNAQPTAAQVTTPQTNDTLKASFTYSVAAFGSTGAPITLHATSNSFNVVAPVTGFTISTLNGTTAGTAQNVTITAMNGSSTATSFTGPVIITSTDPQVTLYGATIGSGLTLNFTSGMNGVMTLTGSNGIDFLTAGSAQTITVTSNAITQTSNPVAITAGAASVVTASAGTPQSAGIGGAFTLPLQVTVKDAYSNPVGGAVVNFSAPASGATATLSASSCTTSLTGTPAGSCSITATANTTVSISPYSVTASVSGVSTPATFLLTNQQITTSVTVAPSATSVVYGQPFTVVATISPASSGSLSPTGLVGFYDNSTTVPFIFWTSSNGVSKLPVSTAAVGQHVYGGRYVGDTNFAASSVALSSSTVTVSKASSTLSGPASQPVQVAPNLGGSAVISVIGQYPSSGANAPTGTVTYTITNASNSSIASGSSTISGGTVTVPVANTLAVGNYTITANYAGDGNYNAATQLAVPLQVGQIQPVMVWAQPSAIPYGATLAGVLNAAAQDQSGATAKSVAGTYVYTVSGSAVTATSVLAASTAAYTINVSFTPTDAVTYKTATGSVTLTVNKATPGIALASSTNTLLVQNPVTLTATVSSAISTPTGSVTFLDGTTSLGTSALVNGAATLSTSSLAVGSHSITAMYAGDTNFVTQTSSASTVLVTDYNLTISTSSSAGSSTSQTVLPGGTATYNFTISPTGATTFPAAVQLSVSGLPTGATYTITPSTIASGAGATNVTLTINVPKLTAMLQRSEKLAPLALAVLLLPFSGRMRRRAGKLPRLAAMLLLLIGGAAGVATLTGCGSSTGFFASQQTTYNVTITGTSGALTHSTTVTLTVQ